MRLKLRVDCLREKFPEECVVAARRELPDPVDENPHEHHEREWHRVTQYGEDGVFAVQEPDELGPRRVDGEQRDKHEPDDHHQMRDWVHGDVAVDAGAIAMGAEFRNQMAPEGVVAPGGFPQANLVRRDPAGGGPALFREFPSVVFEEGIAIDGGFE